MMCKCFYVVVLQGAMQVAIIVFMAKFASRNLKDSVSPERDLVISLQHAHLAETFRNMHHGPRVLLLPNVWDVLSTRLFVAAGFDALATTSGGVAWALGYPDGEAAHGRRWWLRPSASFERRKCR